MSRDNVRSESEVAAFRRSLAQLLDELAEAETVHRDLLQLEQQAGRTVRAGMAVRDQPQAKQGHS